MRDGAQVYLRRHGQPGRHRLVLSHGNGLAMNGYVPFWEPLTAEFDVVLFDIRNHGENASGDSAGHTWASIIDDFSTIVPAISEHFGSAPTIGAFHSLSAIAALNHAAVCPDQWLGLALFDPPTFPPSGHPLQEMEHQEMVAMTERALRRPTTYRSPDDLADQLARRRVFARWVPGAHRMMALATLRQGDDHLWHLCLARELEARIYETNTDAMLWPRLAGLTVPLKLIASDPEAEDAAPSALTCRALAGQLGCAYEMIPGTTHFLQIEKPELCRRALRDFLASLNRSDGYGGSP